MDELEKRGVSVYILKSYNTLALIGIQLDVNTCHEDDIVVRVELLSNRRISSIRYNSIEFRRILYLIYYYIYYRIELLVNSIRFGSIGALERPWKRNHSRKQQVRLILPSVGRVVQMKKSRVKPIHRATSL
jgi:hypothetical protein